jgi:hypothetical protein
MSQTAPPTVDPLATPPSTSSSATFDTRADTFLAQLQTWATQLGALAANVYANAVDAFNNAVSAAASALAASSSATNAAASAVTAGASAGAAAWNAGTAYTLGQRAIDPTFQRVYFRKIAGTTATQPNADATNWAPLDISEVVVPVTGTTGTVYAGATWSLNNAAATAMTLDAAIADSSEFAIILRNGRTDNTLDIGTNTLNGPGGSITGVITFDTSTRVWSFKYIAATTSLEII